MEDFRERTILQTGEEGMALLSSSRVAVIGLGGVGAMAAEMIARAGVGKIIIADSDVYSITNKNRQIAAFVAMGAEEREIITDKESGKSLDRSGYQALKNVILRKGDTLVS